jgi:MFS family permease
MGVWRERRFVLLAGARTISVLGNAFARVALAFAVLALPGATPGRLSLVLSCQALPQLVFVLAGGVIADRMSRSRLMAVSDLVGAGAYAGLALMAFTGRAPLTGLCLLAVLAGTGTALFAPAMAGVVPLIVPAERLQEANALLRLATNLSMLLGLALSGVTVATLGAGWALAVNAGSFLVSAALVGRLRLPRPRRERASRRAELALGWREFVCRQWLWVVVVQFSVVVAVLNATFGVLGPLAADRYLGGAGGWAAIVAGQALGMIAGAGLSVRIRVRRPVLVAVLATFPFAAPVALLAAGAPVWLCAAGAFGSGITEDVFSVLWVTTMQREIPEAVLSRVSAYDAFGSLALAPLGLLVAGPVADEIGTGRALAGCAALVVLSGSAALLSPSVRSLRTPAAEAAATTGPTGVPAAGAAGTGAETGGAG